MRPSIRRAMERLAELTRRNKFVEAVSVAETAFETADYDDHRDMETWLREHADDFVRDPRESR